MGEEKSSEYYDNRMDRVLIPYESSPWRPIYDSVVHFLAQRSFDARILDVGCGTGRCAEAIRRAGFSKYLGIDFSGERVAEAMNYVPSFKFMKVNALSYSSDISFKDFDIFIMTEFLEHVESDLEIIAKIPKGAHIIFSVPNTDSAGHVRFFDSSESVILRYNDLLEFEDQQIISRPDRPHKLTWVFHAMRK